MNDINPRVYIHYVLTKIHCLRKGNVEPEALLPHCIKIEILKDFEREQILLAQKVLSQQGFEREEKELATHDPPE